MKCIVIKYRGAWNLCALCNVIEMHVLLSAYIPPFSRFRERATRTLRSGGHIIHPKPTKNLSQPWKNKPCVLEMCYCFSSQSPFLVLFWLPWFFLCFSVAFFVVFVLSLCICDVTASTALQITFKPSIITWYIIRLSCFLNGLCAEAPGFVFHRGWLFSTFSAHDYSS